MIAVVMGVSGEALASELGWRFIDADDYHPEASVAKMARGEPLDDEDRWPWLDRLNSMIREEARAVLACSALKERYRQRLARGIEELCWVYLKADAALTSLARRSGCPSMARIATPIACMRTPASACVSAVSRSWR